MTMDPMHKSIAAANERPRIKPKGNSLDNEVSAAIPRDKMAISELQYLDEEEILIDLLHQKRQRRGKEPASLAWLKYANCAQEEDMRLDWRIEYREFF